MLTQFLRDEEGQTTVEYLLIIMVVVIVISALGKQLQGAIKGLTERVFGNINKVVDGLMKGAVQ